MHSIASLSKQKTEGEILKKKLLSNLIQIFPTVISSPVVLEISPSPHGKQSKQQTGRPFLVARLVPRGQLSLHTDCGG